MPTPHAARQRVRTGAAKAGRRRAADSPEGRKSGAAALLGPALENNVFPAHLCATTTVVRPTISRSSASCAMPQRAELAHHTQQEAGQRQAQQARRSRPGKA